MTTAIMQPTFYPWIGYFDLIDQSDCFVFLDDVQLTKRSWQVRNRIKLQDQEHFLTIPIEKTGSRDETQILDAKISSELKWKEKHLKSIEAAYRKTDHFEKIYPILNSMYQRADFLADLNIAFIERISRDIGIETQFERSSAMEGIDGTKDLRLVNICKKVGATTYLSAGGSSAYLESATPGGEIVANQIELFYHVYEHPTYNQRGKEFVPFMGIIDLLFNNGLESSLSIIRSGRKERMSYTKYREMNGL